MKQSFLRRLLAAALALCLAAALAVPVCAATLYADGDFRYTVEDGGVIIQNFYGTDAEVTVPASIAGQPVSEIAAGAFAENAAVKTVNLPDTIMQIAEGAFAAGQAVNYNTNVAAPTPTAVPTATPQPGTTAAPDATAAPTATPQPGTTAAPDATAVPTATPQPGTTAVPDATAAPTATPGPGTDTASDAAQTPGGDAAATAAPAGDYGVEEAEVSLMPTDAPAATLAVNEKGNLVQVDEAGNTTVLDDTQTYTTKQNDDGTTEILDAAGQPVTEAPSVTPQPEGSAAPTAEAAAKPSAAPVVLAALALLAVAGGFWLYKRRK